MCCQFLPLGGAVFDLFSQKLDIPTIKHICSNLESWDVPVGLIQLRCQLKVFIGQLEDLFLKSLLFFGKFSVLQTLILFNSHFIFIVIDKHIP